MNNVVNLWVARREAERETSHATYLDALERARNTGSLADMATAVRAFQQYVERQGFSPKSCQKIFDSAGNSWLGPNASQAAQLRAENTRLRVELMGWRTGLHRRES